MKAEIYQNGSLGFFDPNLHTQIPDSAIDISDADYQAHISGDLRQRVGDQWVPYSPPPIPLADHDEPISNAATDEIDAICDGVYTRSPSRTARYRQKYVEAMEFSAAGYPDPIPAGYRYLASTEAPARGLTVPELADLIIARAAAFDQVGAEAEAARAELPGAVVAAATVADKQTAADAIVDRIRTLANQLET